MAKKKTKKKASKKKTKTKAKAKKKAATKKPAKKKREAKTFKLVCPNCGNDGSGSDRDNRIQTVEWVPVFRDVLAAKDDVIFIDYDNYQDVTEMSKDSGLSCGACEHCWEVPSYVTEADIGDHKGPRLDDDPDDSDDDGE